MKDAKSIAKTAGLFFVGNVASKLVVFILLPIYTNYLPASDLGYYDLAVSCTTLLVTIVYIESWTATLRFMYEGDSYIDKCIVAKASLCIVVFSSLLLLMISVAVHFFAQVLYLGLITAYGVSLALANYAAFLCRGFGNNAAFALSGVINTSIMAVLNIVLIVGFSCKAEALFVSAIAGQFAQFGFLAFKTNLYQIVKKAQFDSLKVRELVRFAMPMSVNTVAYWLLSSFGRVAIFILLGDSANGLYSVGYKFSSAVTLVASCFTLAWQDSAFGAFREANRADYYGRMTTVFSSCIFVGGGFLLPFVSLVFPILVGSDYSSAFATIPLFLLVACLNAISVFLGNTILAEKKSSWNLYTAIPGAVCNVLLCFPLVGLWGIDGANCAMAVGYVATIVCRSVALRKLVGQKISGIPVTCSIAVFGMYSVFYRMFDAGGNLTVVLFTAFILAICFIVRGKVK